MFRTITLVAALIGLLAVCAYGQYLFIDDSTNNDILRYNADLSPAPGPGQTGAIWIDWPAKGTQYKLFAAGSDGYLYFTNYTDSGTNQWGVGSEYVQRVNMATAQLDATWKVALGPATTRASSVAFAPDGRLYAGVSHKGVYFVDIAAQTSTQVLSDSVECYDLGFDGDGNAYVASYLQYVVKKYTISGDIWTEDESYDGTIESGTMRAGFMAWKDPWLYVSNYTNSIFRLNSAGVCDPVWYVPGFSSVMQMDFGPDGMLYVNGWTKVWRVDVTQAEPSPEQILTSLPSTGYYMGLAWDLTTQSLPGNLEGKITLEDWDMTSAEKLALTPVTIQLVPKAGGGPLTMTFTLDPSATTVNYTVPNLVDGTYDVYYSACKCLTKLELDVVITSGQTTTKDVSLVNGDADSDNGVNTTDLSVVMKNVGSQGSAP